MIKLILLINIILVLNSTVLYIGFAEKGRCDRELYFNGCCPNTQWNPEKDMCEDCPRGYYWINCSKPCQHPYYGSKCGQTCSCEEENCDHMSGCKNEIKTSAMPSATSEVSKTTTVDAIVTDVVSSKSRTASLSTISKDVANNPLYKPLLILSIIVGVIFVAYISVVAVEKYCM